MTLNGRPALVPFITGGYPDAKKCLQLVQTMALAGADTIELGIPFSDPLADGPIIQEASRVALSKGTKVRTVLRIASQFKGFRKRKKLSTRIVLMTYVNPVLAYGLPEFMLDARRAGVDGVIPVDLIPEEGQGFLRAARVQNLDVTFLVSPTCTTERMRRIADACTGFVYLVSVKGITGARKDLPEGLASTIAKLREVTDKKIYVGFGISTPQQAAAISRLADGVVVGSAILKKVPPKGSSGAPAVKKFVASLRKAIDRGIARR